MITLDAQYILVLRRALPDAVADELREIPGVAVWRARPGLTVPYNAGWLVEGILRAHGFVFNRDFTARVKGARTGPGYQAGLDRALRARELPASWPAGFMRWQQEQIRRGFEEGGLHLNAPAGAGKTRTLHAIAALATGPVLVVTPVRLQWLGEVTDPSVGGPEIRPFAWLPEGDRRKARGDRDLPEYLDEERKAGRRPYVITSWAQIRDHSAMLARDVLGAPWCPSDGTVIFDESQNARNPSRVKLTKEVDEETGDDVWNKERIDHQSTCALDLALAAQRRLTSTATEVPNRLWDLWGQLTLVEPEGWGLTVSRFKVRYCDAIPGEFGGLKPRAMGNGMSNVEELAKRRSFHRVALPYSVTHADLPPKRRRVERVPASALVQAFAGTFKSELRAIGKALANGDPGAHQRLVELHVQQTASMKRPVVVQRVSDYMAGRTNAKVVVFTGRKVDVDSLGESLARKVGLTHGGPPSGGAYWTATGDDSETVRQQIQDDYMAHPGPALLVATWQSMGVGRNLQDTDLHVFAQVPITPEEVIQGEGRTHRRKMTRRIEYLYLIAEGTVDERAATLMIDKLPAVETAADATSIEHLRDQLLGLDDTGIRTRLVAFLQGLADQEA